MHQLIPDCFWKIFKTPKLQVSGPENPSEFNCGLCFSPEIYVQIQGTGVAQQVSSFFWVGPKDHG